MALGILEGVRNEAISSNFELLNFAFPRLSSKSVCHIKNRVPYILLKEKAHLYRTSMCVVLWCPIQDQYVCGIVVPHTGPVCVWYCGVPYRTSMCVVLWCPIQDQYVCGIVVPHTGPVCVWYCGVPYRTSMCVVLWCPIQDQYVCGIVVPHTGPVCVHP